MPNDPAMIWNAILSLALGGFLWWMRSQKQTSDNIYQMLGDTRRRISDTREEMAKDYVMKSDYEKDIAEIWKRFDRVEEKLDRVLMTVRHD